MRGSKAGTGCPDPHPHPPEKSQNIELHSNTGPDPLKFSKLPSSTQRWAIIGTPAKRQINIWRFAGGPMVARF